MRVALLQGCVQQALAPEINAATIRLLTRHGVEVVVPPEAGCCGAFTLHMGKAAMAKGGGGAECRRLACRTGRGRAGRRGRQRLGLRHGRQGLRASARRRSGPLREGRAVAAIARDVTELLAPADLQLPETAVPLSVAYHDACSLQHAQKIRKQPRALLCNAGFDVRDVPEAHFCCGSAGAYNMLQPDMAEALGHRKAGHIESTGATAVAAGNLGCLAQLARFTGRPMLHTVELLDWATGGPLPAALRTVDLPAAVARAKAPDPAAAPPGSPLPAASSDGSTGAAIW